MSEYTYKQWRQELHDLQIKIDELDEAFFDDPKGRTYREYSETDRKVLVDELEAHYKKEPTH